MKEQSDYLLEIGTEELPADFLDRAAEELKDKASEILDKNQLEHGDIKVFKTPRRLTLLVENLALFQPSSEELLKGPPVSVGLDTGGNPTQAALGFARKMGIDYSQLKRKVLEGTEYLVYLRQSPGKPVTEIIPDVMPEVVLSLTGSHFMVWDESGIKFSRPIRWILSLLKDKHLPLEIGLVRSSSFTHGHRFFSTRPEIAVSSVEDYKNILLKEGNVVVDQEERRKIILEGLNRKAQELGGKIPPNENLLDIVTSLVESPAIVEGSFSEKFLSLPKEVIITVMSSHQKYFPVEAQDGSLLPCFITVSNNTSPSAAPVIRHGNEKVLSARLEDASFFFQEDLKHPLEYYPEKLKGITFQKGLGSLYNKTERLKSLVSALGNKMAISTDSIDDAIRAATLCKADLATNMVRELTELQGTMGRHYALLSGEKLEVALAIEEHYRPRFMGDDVARSEAGIILSLADKLDSMTAIFAQKDARHPTGSKDPMGLRRMALGVIQTVVENNLSLNLDEALASAYENLGDLAQESESDTLKRTRQFLLQRFKGYLLDQNYSYDAIDAVLESDLSPLTDINSTIERLGLLKNLQQNPELLKQLYEPANRTARILGKAYNPDVKSSEINQSLFEDSSEGALFEAVAAEGFSDVSSAEQLQIFARWAPIVELFFNNVLVNVDNTELKENRYRLLSLLNGIFRQFADFTKLVVEKCP